MHLHRIDYVLWLVSPVVLSLILLIMRKRGLHLTYPYFVSYSLLQVVSDSVLFGLVKRSYAAYYYAYYSIVFVSAALSMAVFWDIFKNAFQPYPRLRPLPVSIFRSSIVFIVLAVTMIGLHPGAPGPGRAEIDTWVFSAVSATRLAQCGLFLLLLVFGRYLGISRRNVIFGIALGFVLFAVVNMLIMGRAGEFLDGRRLSEINIIAYSCTTFIWLFYVARGSTEFSPREDCFYHFSPVAFFLRR